MSEPVTSVDRRFSEPDAPATSWDDTRELLASAELFWLATVRADGRPHVTPLVAVWADGTIYFCTGEAEQKAINMQANRHVVLLTGCNRWDEGWDVVVEGTADRVTDRDVLKHLAELWTTKWDGRWNYVVGDGHFLHPDDRGEPPETILVFAVTPAKVLAFAKGSFSHTRHRF